MGNGVPENGEAPSPGSSQDGQGFEVWCLIVGKTEERPLMVVVAGANGSGKTSFMWDCLSREGFLPEAWINPDEIAQGIGDWNDPACVKRANIEACYRLKHLLKQRKSFSFESVLSVSPHTIFKNPRIQDISSP